MQLRTILTLRKALVLYLLHLERKNDKSLPKHKADIERDISEANAAMRFIEAQPVTDPDPRQMMLDVCEQFFPGVSNGR
jgi:hypothetical protein